MLPQAMNFYVKLIANLIGSSKDSCVFYVGEFMQNWFESGGIIRVAFFMEGCSSAPTWTIRSWFSKCKLVFKSILLPFYITMYSSRQTTR